MSTLRSPEALVLALLVGAGASLPGSAETIDIANERSRIGQDRAAALAEAAAARLACENQFAVAACVARTDAALREQLLRLRHQADVLDAEQRKRRAALRLQRVEQGSAPAQARSKGDVPAVKATVRPPKPIAKAARERQSAAAAAEKQAATMAAKARAQSRAEAAVRRAAEAAEHRRAVEARNAARAHRRASVKPLPLPASSAPIDDSAARATPR